MLQVRDLPDEVHSELRRRATAAGMSLSDFAGQELARVTRRPSLRDLLDRVAGRGDGEAITFQQAGESVLAERPDE